METNPEMKAKIDAKIAELNAALEALKKDMTPPIDAKKQAQSIENLKQKTMPNGLGMGGQLEYFGLWIDSEFGQVGKAKSGE